MKINQSIAGSLGAGGIQGTQGLKPAPKTNAVSEPIKPAKQVTLESSAAPVESVGASDFLKQESTTILPQAVQEVSKKPTLGKVEISQFKSSESEQPSNGDEAIDKLKQSVNQDILIAMANSGSIV